MTCDKAIRLVEKLADGEANPSERTEAEAHLEGCENCRAHYQFVRALESASEQIALPEPPDAYWQRFPSKVLARIEREEQSGFWQKLRNAFGPSTLRLGALAATVTFVVAVGVTVYREDSRQLEPDMPAASEGLARRQEVASPERRAAEEKAEAASDIGPREPDPSPAQLGAASPSVRDDARARKESDALRRSPAESPSASPDDAAQLNDLLQVDRADEPAPEPPAGRSNRPARSFAQPPAETSLAEQSELEESVSEDSARQQAAPKAREVEAQQAQELQSSGVQARGATRAVLASASDQCAEWRRFLAEHDGDTEQTREARYQVALCSLRRVEIESSDETRQEALRDGDAFLAVENDTERANELRRRLEPLRQ